MTTTLNCIMLIDDNEGDNFFHKRVINKYNNAIKVITEQSAEDALDYLNGEKNHGNTHPELIFLDINMPGMNGWEFLNEYHKLAKKLQGKVIVVMLTTSENPDDLIKAKALNALSDFKTKPLTNEMLDEIITAHFPLR